MKGLLTGLISVIFAAYSYAGQEVVYQIDGENYQGYWAKASDNAPLVLLVHDWDGLTDYEKKRSDMLTELGYNVFAVDLFGQGVRPTKMEDKRQHTGELYKNRTKLRNLMQAGMQQAGKQGGDLSNTVVMGYCFGGAATLESARAGMDAKGFVTFHGGLTTPDGQDYNKTKSPLLVLHGTADTAISMDDFAKLAAELEQQKVPHEMITYSGAPHAFTVFGSPRYREEADQKSWQAFVSFLYKNTD